MNSSYYDLTITPPPLHLLARLISLSYNSPPETASFYAEILLALFPPPVITSINTWLAPEGLGIRGGGWDAMGVNVKGKGKAGGQTQNGTDVDNGHPSAPDRIDPHLAIHVRALTYYSNQEFYSAIGLVKDTISPPHDPFQSYGATGPAYGHSANGGSAQSNADKGRSNVPRPTPCLVCAQILARSCMALGRYDEGLKVLEKAVRDNTHLLEQISLPAIPSPLPAMAPIPPLLLLAQLAQKSNRLNHRPLDISQPLPPTNEAERNGMAGSSSARKSQSHTGPDRTAGGYYKAALKDDPWLWEAWKGLCNIGEFISQNDLLSKAVEQPLGPYPEGLLPASVHNKIKITSINNPSSPFSEAASTTSAAPSTSTEGHRRKTSPLPVAGPMFKSMAQGGSSLFTPVMEDSRFKQQTDFQRGPTRPSHALMSDTSFGSPSWIGDTSFPALGLGKSRAPMFQSHSMSTTSHAAPSPAVGPTLLDFAANGSSQPPTSISSVLSQATATDSQYASGLGKPPATKRQRGSSSSTAASTSSNGHFVQYGANQSKANLPRHATGRNVSDVKRSDDELTGEGPGVRRSSRLRQNGRTPESSLAPPTRTTHKGQRAMSQSTTSDHEADSDRPRKRSVGSSEFMSSPPSTGPRGGTAMGNGGHDLSPAAISRREADRWLFSLMSTCGQAFAAFTRFDCVAATMMIARLPEDIREGPWALSLLGKAYYEMADYVQARRAFERLRKLEPYRLQDMEYYSTSLWHLGDAPALSFLAQQLMAIDRESSAAWIATGNCFSLRRECDEAMRCFRRASSLDSSNPYAFTLSGYEALEMEEYDRAIAFYQMAVRTDTRHYNAWYGLGLVYQKTGRSRHAEYHFRRAIQINPSNAVLLCCVGTVLEKRKLLVKALDVYERALSIAPQNNMVRFKAIRVLIATRRYDEALPLLTKLASVASSEAKVIFLLGKLHRMMGQQEKATIQFAIARELDPKLSGIIKSFTEGIEADEAEEGDNDGSSKQS